MNKFWDDDISALKLTDTEKNGLQVFRNYKKAFDKRTADEFIDEINKADFDLAPLQSILNLIQQEHIRLIPVYFCSFADEQLENMFRREIPENVPSGRASMLGGFGGLSRFSQRIQSAFAFHWMTPDILLELDKLRKLRNDLSHTWDVDSLKIKLESLIDVQMYPLEKEIGEEVKFPKEVWKMIPKESLFRIRLIWLSGRCFYESQLYPQIIKRRLDEFQTLYGNRKPNLLMSISKECQVATSKLTNGHINKGR